MPSIPLDWVHKATTRLLLGAVLLTAVAWGQKGSFVDYHRVDPSLLAEPVQAETTREALTFDYRGASYRVRPVADYDIRGLVVSLNDATAFYDIYHDRNSVDTRDLGLIWGPNLQSNDFHDVKFWSVSWSLNWKYRRGVTFDPDAISNNHLITAKKTVREQIARVRVGDQIQMRGMLVDYADARYPDQWRSTSTTRGDYENGACEVLFVDELQILERGTPVWYTLWALGKWAIPLLVVLKIGLASLSPDSVRRREQAS